MGNNNDLHFVRLVSMSTEDMIIDFVWLFCVNMHQPVV